MSQSKMQLMLQWMGGLKQSLHFQRTLTVAAAAEGGGSAALFAAHLRPLMVIAAAAKTFAAANFAAKQPFSNLEYAQANPKRADFIADYCRTDELICQTYRFIQLRVFLLYQADAVIYT